MVTGNAINLTATGLAKYDGAGTFSGVTLTQHAMLVGAASNGITSQLLTNGQLMIGNTSNDPTAATLSAGTGVTITNAAGSITINASGGGLTWTTVSGTSQAAAVGNGYVTNNAGAVTVTLPATAAVGDTVEIAGLGAGGWIVAVASGQSIHLGSSTTTTTTGTLASTNRYDNLIIRCLVANTEWTAKSMGNITVT